jgi:hypothetical protein
MFSNLPPIYFYFPKTKLGVTSLPENSSSYWEWQCNQHSISPMQGGGCIWTLQTYLYLNDHGFPCQLVAGMPEEGIIVSHRDYLSDDLQPNSKSLIVCLRADVNRHPYAQLHVVQNPHQDIAKSSTELWESHFIPHWPQPAIIPRDPTRADLFENVTFLGNEVNLVPEFRDQSWYDQLDQLGLKFQKKLNHNEWHDYSSTDVILAVRSMGTQNKWNGKPASKLYNAWHSGIPAILGCESAFQAERKNELDYLEAISLEEVIIALSRLKNEKDFRLAMVENGWLRSQETQLGTMVERWQNFLVDIAVPAYRDWCSMTSLQQNFFFKARQSFITLRPIGYKLRDKISNLIKRK